VNAFRNAVLAGDVLLGAWCMLSDPFAAQLVGNAGYDWLVIDMEHGPVPLQAVQTMVTAIGTTGAVPLVRPPWKDSASLQVALDSGARGLLVPMVNGLAEARSVVADTRFVPLGERSRGGSRAALAFGADAAAYFRESNAWTVVMVQIETRAAVTAAHEIAALDGIDCLFVGPFDLAGSYGVDFPEIWERPDGPYGEAIAAIPRIARAAGKAAGILANDATMARRCIALGYSVVGIAVDATMLATGARRALAELR